MYLDLHTHIVLLSGSNNIKIVPRYQYNMYYVVYIYIYILYVVNKLCATFTSLLL